MALTITDTQITSDEVGEYASRQSTGWFVTSWPGRLLDRNQAITAMTIAEELAKPAPDHVLIKALESELR